ncbi:OmpA family protein [Flavobacterium sp. MAH-1]|uniref:OmpA family protein n=1 Tax=Flavobacterium agri TaxID=2743471 RepID=A0A7Y8XZP5_9FLAO|nr:OmpA family protein [Flavobacterium agri]NUY79901.1 OmpA family protein [Flavobacterium agri]NYA69926.1 OmpA family protein [Flavobacterium agri]
MRKELLLLTFGLLAFGQVSAQTEEADSKEVSIEDTYNKWTIEAGVGQARGMRPYTEGYYSSNPNSVLGSIRLNSYSLGVRYMISPKFGFKIDGNYDKFENNDDTESKPFEVQQLRFQVQGVINASRLLNLEEVINRFGLLAHGGLSYGRITPKLDTGIDPVGGPSNEGRTENNLGVVFGLTPQFRILDRLAIYLDVSSIYNFRQHFAWDGHYSNEDQNLQGQMLTGSLGLSYSLGSNPLHGDWGLIEDKKEDEIAALDKRIGDLETMMNDADKDGVPDYLDVENNSIPGVAVDTKGRMVDMNQNGVPDELEKYVNTSVKEGATQAAQQAVTDAAQNGEIVKELINDGYIAVFFDFGSVKPTPSSTENVAFILNYLRNNPSTTADITGYADEIGGTEFNKSLSGKRAEYIRNVLIKAGIDGSRLNIVPAGEDTSVDKDSDMARRLVRKAIFHIK